jgi:hypothetical protein
MLKPDVMRLSDVDLAVELVTKEADFDRAREQNYRRPRNWPKREGSSGTSSTGNYAGISRRGISSRREAA